MIKHKEAFKDIEQVLIDKGEYKQRDFGTLKVTRRIVITKGKPYNSVTLTFRMSRRLKNKLK